MSGAGLNCGRNGHGVNAIESRRERQAAKWSPVCVMPPWCANSLAHSLGDSLADMLAHCVGDVVRV